VEISSTEDKIIFFFGHPCTLDEWRVKPVLCWGR